MKETGQNNGGIKEIGRERSETQAQCEDRH